MALARSRARYVGVLGTGLGFLLPMLAAFHQGGCGDGATRTSPTAPPASPPSGDATPPSLLVVTSTAGHNIDPDGYVLVVDGTEQGPIGANASRALEGVSPGVHAVDLMGVDDTCHPHASLPVAITVASSGATRADLGVECLGIPTDVQIAFARIRLDPRSSHIAGMASDGSRATELTSHTAFDTDAAWSPDGTQLAFSRDGVLHILNEEGTRLVPLVPGTAPAWSPDGAAVAFERRVAGGLGCLGTIHLIESRRAERQLASGVEPTWSPDGNVLAFEQCAGVGDVSDIVSIGVDGGAEINLTMSLDVEREPAWSPDGTWIAFRKLVAGESSYSLWVMDATGAAQRVPVHGAGTPLSPAWTPDGRLLFNTDLGSVYVVNLDGTGLKRLTNESGTTDSGPTWRPRP